MAYDYPGQAAAQRAHDNACDCCNGADFQEPKAPHPMSHWKVRTLLRERKGRPALRYTYRVLDKRTGLAAMPMRYTVREPDPLYSLRNLRDGILRPYGNLAATPQQQAAQFAQRQRSYGALLAEIASPVVLP